MDAFFARSGPITYVHSRNDSRSTQLPSGRAGGGAYSVSPSAAGQALSDAFGNLSLAARGDANRSAANYPEIIDDRDLGGGVRQFTALDRQAGVQTHWSIGPLQDFGPHQFLNRRILSRGGDDDDEDDDDDDDDDTDDSADEDQGRRGDRSEYAGVV
jgi:hypothetical protein